MSNNILSPPSNYADIISLQTNKMDKSANLSDVDDIELSFGNIKQNATETSTGVVERATDAEVRAETPDKIPDASQLSLSTRTVGPPVVPGTDTLSTVSTSTTVTLPAADYEAIQPGSTIIANSLTRTVLTKDGANAVTIDTATDFSTGYTFTYQNPIMLFEASDGTIAGWIRADKVVVFTDYVYVEMLETERATLPGVQLKDENCVDDDVNAELYAEATDTGSGTEDVDLFLRQQINGVMTVLFHADADGDIEFTDSNRNVAFSKTKLAGSTGGLVQKTTEATGTTTAATSFTIQANIPSGAKIEGCQLRNDVALTSSDGGTTYSAAYSGGGSGAICSGTAFAKNTKENSFTSEVTTGETDITVTCDDAKTFEAGGEVTAIVYYSEFTAMEDGA